MCDPHQSTAIRRFARCFTAGCDIPKDACVAFNKKVDPANVLAKMLSKDLVHCLNNEVHYLQIKDNQYVRKDPTGFRIGDIVVAFSRVQMIGGNRTTSGRIPHLKILRNPGHEGDGISRDQSSGWARRRCDTTYSQLASWEDADLGGRGSELGLDEARKLFSRHFNLSSHEQSNLKAGKSLAYGPMITGDHEGTSGRGGGARRADSGYARKEVLVTFRAISGPWRDIGSVVSDREVDAAESSWMTAAAAWRWQSGHCGLTFSSTVSAVLMAQDNHRMELGVCVTTFKVGESAYITKLVLRYVTYLDGHVTQAEFKASMAARAISRIQPAAPNALKRDLLFVEPDSEDKDIPTTRDKFAKLSVSEEPMDGVVGAGLNHLD
ncbi:hypothetical protein B0H12DRAFT_1072256 [Mycena haematopus]|nr:hypothetical protein B0H12DRAFT_1072256 [Mycena haematopus]